MKHRTKYPMLTLKKDGNAGSFVRHWSRLYDPAQDEEVYDRLIQRPTYTRDDIESLFAWKNTGYGRNWSKDKQNTIRRIQGQLGLVNQLKDQINLQCFEKQFGRISLVWRVFLLHIICPSCYPVIDQHAGRACIFLSHGKVEEIRQGRCGWVFYHDEYVPFFNGLVSDSGLTRKKVDEALWGFGKFLKSKAGKIAVGGDQRE